MRRWNGLTRLMAGLLAVVFLGLTTPPLCGGENPQTFLDGLRQREYYDVALDLLKTLRDSPDTDAAFRETLDYQFGITLLGGARVLPPEEREKQLDEARKYLEKFLADHPHHPLCDSAMRNLSDLKINRGEAQLDEARQPGKTPDEKKRLLDRAREQFEEAQKSLKEIDDRLKKKKSRYKIIDKDDARQVEEYNRLLGEMMRTRFSWAKTYYDIAQTHEPGDKGNVTSLREAAAKFSEYYWMYHAWLMGYYFRLEQARCYKELGDYDKALEILDVLAAPDPDEEEDFRRVRTAAARMALQIDLLPQVKKYKEAWELFEKWEQSVRRPGRAVEAAPDICYLGGEAALEIARGLGENDPQQARLRSLFRKRAKELLMVAARYPGEYQLKARLKLNDPLLSSGQLRIERPKNYEEARDRANLAWSQAWGSDLKPEQVQRMRAEALECLRFALAHPPEDVKIDELNVIRLRLALLDWVIGEYYDAAVLGETLARRYADRPEGEQGAKVALGAYTGLLQEVPPGADHRFETERIEDLARFTEKQWPKTPLADDARLTLIRIAVTDNEPQKALEQFSHVSADSPRRGEAELLTGQSLWREYLEAVRLPKQRQPTTAKITEMLSNAQQMLTDGVDRLRKRVEAGEQVPYLLAVGTLSLAQICLESNQGEKAVQWLDDPKIGAHTLAKSGNKEYDRGNFRAETFQAALRAYASTERLQKAELAMDGLEKAAPAADLTRIYVTLGRLLEKTLERLQTEGKRAEAERVMRGFELYLTRIANRPANEIDFNTLYWVAETFVKLGSSLAPEDGKLTPEAEKYSQKAALAYGRIVDICRENKEFAPNEGTVDAIQIRLARCLRRLGKFDEAMNLLVEILAVRNNQIDAQREAAYTYQDWGQEKPGYYMLAINGGRRAKQKNGEIVNLVWGWSGIARKVQFSEPHQDIFNEARYNHALCRLNYALGLAGKEKTRQLQQAEQDILLIQRLRPEMGGKKWYNQYDALLRKIQGLLGTKEDQRGLKASEQKMSGASK